MEIGYGSCRKKVAQGIEEKEVQNGFFRKEKNASRRTTGF